MWAPLGNNWYDSLQMKATKRYSHGLDFTAAFTWSKELATGQGVNDVFNRAEPEVARQLLAAVPVRARASITRRQKFTDEQDRAQAVPAAGRWAGLLRYTSGMPIAVPSSHVQPELAGIPEHAHEPRCRASRCS